MKESIFCNIADFVYLKSTESEIGDSKGTQTALLMHSKNTQGTWTLGYSSTWGTCALEGDLGTRATGTLRHLSTRARKGHLDKQALRHSGTGALDALEALYLADSL